ncbi:MAG: 50S ribosomal protein L32 [Dehalococcoidia bacterium]
MPPLPKRKYPKARQGKRRSHINLPSVHVVECPQCRNPRLTHHACPVCGYYKGREAVRVGAPNLPE